MTEIRFYHLERQNMLQAVPGLVAKAYDNGHRIVIKLGNEKDVQVMNDHLWSYSPDSFIPHGGAKDGHAHAHPIWLTDKHENPNDADLLISLDGSEHEMLTQFSLCCDMFDGRNEEAVAAARKRWSAYKEAGHEMTYWQQGDSGWEKKS